MPQRRIFQSGYYTDAQGVQRYGINPADVENYGNDNPLPTPEPVTRTPRFPDYQTDTTLDDFYKNLYDQSNASVDETGIRQSALTGVQSELDALNQIYDNILANVRIAGAGRSGSERSIAAKKGTVGSEIGEANKEKVTQYNQQEEQAVQAERAAKLANVLQRAQGRADAQIESEKLKKTEQADKYIQYLKEQNAAARNDIGTLAASGMKLEDIADQDYLKLLKDSGFDSETEFEAYWNARSPKEAQVKYDYKELKDGTLLRTGDDGSYKVLTDIALPQEGNWTITQLDDGTLVAYDKNQSADGTFKMETLGKYAKAKATGGGGSSQAIKLTSAQKTKLARIFNSQEITDLQDAVNELGVDGVLENVTDAEEKALIQEIFGVGKQPDYEDTQEDARLKDMGYSAADIREYKKAKTANPYMSIDPVQFLQGLNSARESGDASDYVDQWING